MSTDDYYITITAYLDLNCGSTPQINTVQNGWCSTIKFSDLSTTSVLVECAEQLSTSGYAWYSNCQNDALTGSGESCLTADGNSYVVNCDGVPNNPTSKPISSPTQHPAYPTPAPTVAVVSSVSNSMDSKAVGIVGGTACAFGVVWLLFTYFAVFPIVRALLGFPSSQTQTQDRRAQENANPMSAPAMELTTDRMSTQEIRIGCSPIDVIGSGSGSTLTTTAPLQQSQRPPERVTSVSSVSNLRVDMGIRSILTLWNMSVVFGAVVIWIVAVVIFAKTRHHYEDYYLQLKCVQNDVSCLDYYGSSTVQSDLYNQVCNADGCPPDSFYDTVCFFGTGAALCYADLKSFTNTNNCSQQVFCVYAAQSFSSTLADANYASIYNHYSNLYLSHYVFGTVIFVIGTIPVVILFVAMCVCVVKQLLLTSA